MNIIQMKMGEGLRLAAFLGFSFWSLGAQAVCNETQSAACLTTYNSCVSGPFDPAKKVACKSAYDQCYRNAGCTSVGGGGVTGGGGG